MVLSHRACPPRATKGLAEVTVDDD